MNKTLIEAARKIAEGWSQCDGHTAAADWINALCDELEKAAANWTPCEDGLPIDTLKPYDITAEVNVFGEKMLVTDVLRYSGDGKWQEFEGSDGMDYKIVAWKKRPEPWAGKNGEDGI